jgi:starvation-inducible DNA-binding protein
MAARPATLARPKDRRPAPDAAPSHATAIEALQEALNLTFLAYRDTHLAHFNVRGAAFPQLHALFEQQYTELWEAVDEVAERIRALGHLVTHGALALPDSNVPQDAGEMLDVLIAEHTAAVLRWQELFDLAEEIGDHATADLCNQRVRAHQKHAWMLEATAS